MAFLNQTGVEHLWSHIISRLNRKVDRLELATIMYPNSDDNGKVLMVIDGKHVWSSISPMLTDDNNGNVTMETTSDYSINKTNQTIEELQERIATLENLLNNNEYLVTNNE